MNHHRHPQAALVASLALVLSVSACSDAPTGPGRSTSAMPRGADPVEIDPTTFTPASDNRYFPLVPGTRWTFREVGVDGSRPQVRVTVTSRTRRIADGVTARVVRDTVTEDGEVTEDTFDWYAQDDGGSVWYFGEDTAEFEDGAVTTREGSFEAGVDEALPGIIMPAHPEAGQSYRQELYAGHAEDNGAVLAEHQQVESPQGWYDDAVLTADTSAPEPRVLEYKLYAPDVGLVLTLDASGGSAREELLTMETVTDAAARAAGTAPLGTPYP